MSRHYWTDRERNAHEAGRRDEERGSMSHRYDYPDYDSERAYEEGRRAIEDERYERNEEERRREEREQQRAAECRRESYYEQQREDAYREEQEQYEREYGPQEPEYTDPGEEGLKNFDPSEETNT